MATYYPPRKISKLDELDMQDTGGAIGVIVIVLGNGHGDTSSNPGRDW